jgi:hypothetical protein
MSLTRSLFLVLLTSSAFGQSPNLDRFIQQKNSINATGMILLGGWAASNILIGTAGHFTARGESKYFHQFNAIWNTINLTLAINGYVGATSGNSLLTLTEATKEISGLQQFLALNIGLDVAYITAGLLLKEKGRTSDHGERLRGYGNSLLVQGSFLLLFDIGLFLFHQQNTEVYLYPLLENSSAGIGMMILL